MAKRESIQYRVRIEGTLFGEKWVYEDAPGDKGSNFYHPEDNDPSEFWWDDGNMGCDCNRYGFLPLEMKAKYPDTEGNCSLGLIMIDRIIPLDTDFPILELNDTEKYKD